MSHKSGWNVVVVYPTPLPFSSGGSDLPACCLQPPFRSIWPAVPSLRRGLSIHPGVTMCVPYKRADGCELASNLCKNDLTKGDLF